MRLGHDASLEQAGAQHSLSPVMPRRRSGDCLSMRLQGSQTRVNSRICGRKVGTSRYSGAAGSRRRVFLFRRVRWNDSNRGALAKQGRLTWLRNLIQPCSTSILKIPRKRPRPTARWTEILWPVWLAHFRRHTRSAPRSREARVDSLSGRLHADRFSGKKKRPQLGGGLRPLKVICVSLVWQRR